MLQAANSIYNRSALMLLFLSFVSCADAPEVPLKARLIDFGVVRPTGSQRQAADASSATGFVTQGDAELQSHSTIVPAIQGTAFGIYYGLDGVPTDHNLRLTQIIRHPPMKKPDGTVIQEQVSYQDVA